jgi:hypothetical protein
LRSQLLVTSLSIFLFSIGTTAQNQTPEPISKEENRARALVTVSAALSTMGNPDRIAKHSVAKGTISFADGSKGTLSLESYGPRDIQSSVVVNGETLGLSSSEGRGQSTRNGKTSTLPSWITEYQGPEHIPALSRLSLSGNPNVNTEHVGVETLNGNSVHHVKLTAVAADETSQKLEEHNSEFHAFIDEKTNLVVKINSYIFSPDTVTNRSLVETYYTDYRTVNGIAVPFHIVRNISGQKDSEIDLNEVTIGETAEVSQ